MTNPDAVDLGGVVVLLRSGDVHSHRGLHLQLLDLACQPPGVALQFPDRRRRLLPSGADYLQQFGERFLTLLQELHRGRAGDRLDPPDAGRNAALVGDDERPDVAGRPAVRAAAELDRETGDGHDPDPFAVFPRRTGPWRLPAMASSVDRSSVSTVWFRKT